MVPSIAKNGSSFRGAGAYYLRDKAEQDGPKLSTSARVAWTATRNLINDDPEKAGSADAGLCRRARTLAVRAGAGVPRMPSRAPPQGQQEN